MALLNWFQYSDREESPYNPTNGSTITLESFWVKEEGKFDAVDWQREEWLTKSALVPIEQLNEAAIKIKSPDDLKFHIGWDYDDKFNFGNFTQYGEIELFPLYNLIKHPVNQDYQIELSREFTIYHALEKRHQTEYYHPVDQILVAETKLDSHAIYDPTARVTIHRDYLRDFLAEQEMGLLIAVIADRFANAGTEEELELEQIEDKQIDEFTWLSTIIHPPEHTHHSFSRGRSIFRRNFIIKPYDKPKYERTPWYYFGKKYIDEDQLPKFKINDEGEEKPLPQNTFLENYIDKGIGKYGYLYFRTAVLQKYLHTPGYNVFFHMRNWGVASLPGDRGTIDVGINSQGLVNAFAPDIADLTPSEQAYWASFSSIPSGEICEEMFQTRMQSDPPNSPGVVDLIREVCAQLSSVFKKQFSVELSNEMEPSSQELSMLSVGPINNQFTEVSALAKILYGWVIETMQTKALRTTLKTLGGAVDDKWRQIKLLEEILTIKESDKTKARNITAPLAGLNDLRVGSAHIGSPKFEAAFQLIGVTGMPKTPREGWNLYVDAVTKSLTSISSILDS
ncbi:hypothetical protein [Anabaena sp. CCY 0017]|uniref:hypothetical protein n=1 Tax=Anabaena sp. CCY 0017 TaxID=3103866 RepID=UPI0039C5E93A